jgi:AcrR family transcriptional regulator
MATALQPPRPTRRTAAYDGKFERVLGTGAAVFAREGYDRATVRQVARETGMSLAGLYHYFASKEELLFLLQYHTFDSILAELERKLEKVRRPRERLRLVVENHLGHFLAHMNELKVCVHEMASLQGEYYLRVQDLRRRYFRTTIAIVEEVAEEAGHSELDARLATLYLFGMLNWIYMWYPAAGKVSKAELTQQLVRLFLEGFLPRGKRRPAGSKGGKRHV